MNSKFSKKSLCENAREVLIYLANVLYKTLDNLVTAFHKGVASLNGKQDAMGFMLRHDELSRKFAAKLNRQAA